MTQKEFVRSWFKNIDEKNFDTLQGLMAENHRFNNPMTPEAIGAEDHIGMMQMMTGAWDGTHNIDLLLEEGNHVVVKGHWSGKHVGEFNGVPATGNNVTFSWIDIFEIVDGKVANEYFEMNPMSIMAQIGALETENA